MTDFKFLGREYTADDQITIWATLD